MTIGIQWGDANSAWSGLIYLDAVTTYNRSYSGQVTKHPIDGGISVTDHFIRENPKFTLSAVISSVDIDTQMWVLPSLYEDTVRNARPYVQPVYVESSDLSQVLSMLPASISQFVGTNKPKVTLDAARQQDQEGIRDLLTSLIEGYNLNPKTLQFENDIQVVNLLEFDGLNLRRSTGNLVITNIAYNETPDTGDGLYVDITLERVNFVTLRSTEIPADVAASINKQAAAKSDKGKQDSTTKDPDDPDNKDPEKRKSVALQAVESGGSLIEKIAGGL